MPRNGSGTHSLTTTFVANTPALAADVNTVLGDISSSLTASLAIDGQSAMTGQLKAADGTITAPGLGFSSDTNTGFYRSASGVIRASLDGTNTLTLTATGVSVTGTLSVSGAVTGVFASGTAMIFAQTAAPTGWTKSTTHNDKALRVVSGTASSGGSTAFTSVFAARTIAEANLPAHTHAVTDAGHTHTTDIDYTTTGGGGSSRQFYGRTGTLDIGSSGDLKPSSSATTGITLANTGSGTAMDFAVQYVDVIIATKD